MSDCIFYQDGDYFVPTRYAEGPWAPQWQHGSPPAALLCYGVEQHRSHDMHLARLTIDLFRAVPMTPLKLETDVIRDGKRIKAVAAVLFDEQGTEICRASSLFFGKTPLDEIPERFAPAHCDIPYPGSFEPLPFVNTHSTQVMAGLNGIMEMQRVEGVMGSGSGTCWTRLPINVISGVENTPNLRAAIASDYGNGIGQVHVDQYTGFINADINLYLHREPVGEWVCVEAKGIAEATGVGLVESRLYDQLGAFGKVVQTTMANQRRPKP